MRVLALLFAFAVPQGVLAEVPLKISLRVEGPPTVQAGRPLTLRFVVRNDGASGIYFKQPWKWASNGMLVRATDTSGATFESDTILYHVRADVACTFFKPLAEGEEFSFAVEFGNDEGAPRLRLPGPGAYDVSWVYNVRHYDDDDACAQGGWQVFKGSAKSKPMKLRVTR